MNNEQNQKKELKKLPGFYIALCCCVLVIGLAGYFTERRSGNNSNISDELNESESVFSGNIDSYTDDAVNRNAVPASETVTKEEYAEEAQAQDESQSQESSASQTDTVSPDVPAAAETQPVYNSDPSEYTEEYEADNPDVMDTAVIVSAEDEKLEAPVSGDLLESFSDKLVYNSAMSDWRTHDGVDLAAEVGCSVHAAANGTISKIFSGATGEGVEIEHAGGLITRYTGLKSVESFNEGDSVAAGDVIGLVGESKGENVTAPHLHFEVYKDGTAVNPSDYM